MNTNNNELHLSQQSSIVNSPQLPVSLSPRVPRNNGIRGNLSFMNAVNNNSLNNQTIFEQTERNTLIASNNNQSLPNINNIESIRQTIADLISQIRFVLIH